MSIVDKQDCLTAATEIAKEYARGGSGSGAHGGPAEVLEQSYRKLVALLEETNR